MKMACYLTYAMPAFDRHLAKWFKQHTGKSMNNS